MPRNRTISRPGTPLAERFWPRVNKHGPIPDHRPELGPCWIWDGCPTLDNYGHVSRHGRRGESPSATHRIAYELLIGPIPEGHDLDHLCRVRACCNPAHLEPVTRQVNLHRGAHPNMVAHANNTCKHGHELTPDNTYLINDRKRGPIKRCRRCRVEAMQRQRDKAKGILVP